MYCHTSVRVNTRHHERRVYTSSVTWEDEELVFVDTKLNITCS